MFSSQLAGALSEDVTLAMAKRVRKDPLVHEAVVMLRKDEDLKALLSRLRDAGHDVKKVDVAFDALASGKPLPGMLQKEQATVDKIMKKTIKVMSDRSGGAVSKSHAAFAIRWSLGFAR